MSGTWVRRLKLEWAGLPRLMRVGLVAFGAASAVDLSYHASPMGWMPALDRVLGPDAVYIHWTMLLGMLIIMAAVVAVGVAQTRLARARARRPEAVQAMAIDAAPHAG